MATTLKEILGAILSDTLRAQHDANSFLQMMSEQYATGGRLAGFKLPTAGIGELEFKLNYAVTDGVEQREEEGVNNREIDKTLRYVSREVSTLLIKTMVHTIQTSGVNYKPQFEFVDSLTENREFQRHLSRRFSSLLSADKDGLLDREATLKEEAVRSLLLNAAEEHLVDHEDIRMLFKQDDAKGLREGIMKEFDRVLQKELDDILRESTMPTFRRIQRYGSLNVEIANDALAKLPPEAIQTMTIKITPSKEEINLQTEEKK